MVERQWVQLRLEAAMHQAVDESVLNSIVCVTGGSFRVLQGLFAQSERVLTIHGLATDTTDVVDAARVGLVVSAH